MAARGCGTRKAGGVYLVCGLSRYGKPVEDFLVDAPKALVASDGVVVDLPKIGQVIQDAQYDDAGKLTMPTLVLDWVGSKHYPNVADFVEEVRVMGMSRKVSPRLDFTKLTAGSRQILVHERAIIKNAEDYQKQRAYQVRTAADGGLTDHPYCPKMHGETTAAQIVAHKHMGMDEPYSGMCAGLWWEDLDGADNALDPGEMRRSWRKMPSFAYYGYSRPVGVTPEYQAAIFMSLPITRIEIIDDPERDTNREVAQRFDATVERASTGQLPVAVVPE